MLLKLSRLETPFKKIIFFFFFVGCSGSSLLHQAFPGCGGQEILPSFSVRASLVKAPGL